MSEATPFRTVPTPLSRVTRGGRTAPATRDLAAETPVAISLNGIGYAVLMATPGDLLDLAWGFALAERLIDAPGDIVDAELLPRPAGLLLRLVLTPERAGRVADRVRHRTTDSSCGLCGIESLDQAMRDLPPAAGGWQGSDAAIFAAQAALDAHQPLNRATGAVHAAALCGADGTIRLVREDVGRHNAFDKLIGAMLRTGTRWDGGFALLTSRCSYELVEKAVVSGCPLLATISAPTALAAERAAAAGLPLRVLVRGDALLAMER